MGEAEEATEGESAHATENLREGLLAARPWLAAKPFNTCIALSSWTLPLNLLLFPSLVYGNDNF